MDYLVVYTSNTGNTEKVAMKIFDSIPGRSKDIQRLEELRDGEADTYFVGFWNDRGTCGSRVMEFLSGLHGKKVALSEPAEWVEAASILNRGRTGCLFLCRRITTISAASSAAAR